MSFINGDIQNKRVLEVGSGTGRITKRLVQMCEKVLCVDLCERMLKRNELEVGDNKERVKYERSFIQEFKPPARRFDAVICSLVLVHNVHPEDFKRAIEVMCRCADFVFVFEDVTEGRRPETITRPVSVSDLLAVFASFGFEVIGTPEQHDLFDDKIAFLRFARTSKRRLSTKSTLGPRSGPSP